MQIIGWSKALASNFSLAKLRSLIKIEGAKIASLRLHFLTWNTVQIASSRYMLQLRKKKDPVLESVI